MGQSSNIFTPASSRYFMSIYFLVKPSWKQILPLFILHIEMHISASDISYVRRQFPHGDLYFIFGFPCIYSGKSCDLLELVNPP